VAEKVIKRGKKTNIFFVQSAEIGEAKKGEKITVSIEGSR